MAIFWERVYVLFVFCLFVILVISHFEGGILIASVPGHCLLVIFNTSSD